MQLAGCHFRPRGGQQILNARSTHHIYRHSSNALMQSRRVSPFLDCRRALPVLLGKGAVFMEKSCISLRWPEIQFTGPTLVFVFGAPRRWAKPLTLSGIKKLVSASELFFEERSKFLP